MREFDSTADAGRLGIGALARRAGCSVDTIRFYERAGLLPRPARSGGGQRRYDEAAARRLVFIRRLRELGFGLDEIARFLRTLRRRPYSCAEFKRSADVRAAQIRQKIVELRRLERGLREISARCASAGPADCGLVDALWTAGMMPADADAAACCHPPGQAGDSPGAPG